MAARPLRRILTLQPLLAMLLPFGLLALSGIYWLLPQIRTEANRQQFQIALAISSHVESYLETGTVIVEAAAAVPNHPGMTLHNYQRLMDAMLAASETLNSIYVVRPDGRVTAVSLKAREQKLRQDLNSIDLSRNELFREVALEKTPHWSKVFLSAISGGLTSAYAVSGNDRIVIGEIDLTRLNSFLKQASGKSGLLIMIVDRNGQVIADHDGRYTAQQFNISNIPLVRIGIETSFPSTDRFDFSGESMTGSIIKISNMDWYVLVAQKDAQLFKTAKNMGWIVLAYILIALSCAITVSIYLARSMARRFDVLARYARDFAGGQRSGSWPQTSIAEFNQLSGNLQSMAETLHQQELVLRDSEARMACLYNISQYPFRNEREFLDHALDEAIALTGSTLGYIFFYSEAKRQLILGGWSGNVVKECEIHEQKTTYDLDSTGIWGEVVRQKKTILLNDFAAHHPLKKGIPEGHVALRRFLSIPVIADNSIVAVAGVANKEGDYLESDVMQLTLFMDAVWKIVSRKRAEDERHRLEQQLLHAQKLESLGVLAGGIAHDFNNILTAIIGNADLALMRINKESPATENLQRIEQAAIRAADLAKQMLAYSGKGRFVVESLDMNLILQDMLHMLEVSISKKAVLRLNLHQPLPPVEADATQIRQIVMNLVINASEAIGDKSGVIAITTGCMDCDESYLKDVWLDENLGQGLYVYLEISDTGCGMDKETLSKLFDPFFTTKFTGRGLGMAAVLGIVRGHKGAIKVYSEVDKGTSFKILLPASGRPVEIFNGESQTDDWSGSGTVLLVDDEETVRGIGAEMLKELGFNPITANDGRQALEVFQSRSDIALVILDLTMPHMDGEQCFRELRQLDPEVKVIMSSGYNEQEVTGKFRGKGLAGFIQKPYKLSVLRDELRNITENRQE